MITSEEFVRDENTGQSEDSVATAAKKPAKKIAKKAEVLEATPETTDNPIDKINQDNVMVYMKSGHSYYLPDISFTKEEPFQLMNAIDAERLIRSTSYRFDYATKEQVENFYSLG